MTTQTVRWELLQSPLSLLERLHHEGSMIARSLRQLFVQQHPSETSLIIISLNRGFTHLRQPPHHKIKTCDDIDVSHSLHTVCPFYTNNEAAAACTLLRKHVHHGNENARKNTTESVPPNH